LHRPAAKGAIAVDLIELLEYLERRKRQCEDELRHAQTPGFRLFEVSAAGEVDITEQHKQRLRKACEGYQQAIDSLKAQNPQ
jgi:hypothetical protein